MLHKALKALRVGLDMTQAEVAVKIGKSRTYVTDLERGELTKPPLDVLTAYAEMSGVSLSSIMFFVEEEEQNFGCEWLDKGKRVAREKAVEVLERMNRGLVRS
ncbi:helix-turn-helix domain-containing protein [Magnetococcales bacterium HHB-1]